MEDDRQRQLMADNGMRSAEVDGGGGRRWRSYGLILGGEKRGKWRKKKHAQILYHMLICYNLAFGKSFHFQTYHYR